MRKIKCPVIRLTLFFILVVAFSLISFQDLISTEGVNQSENVKHLRNEWQRQAKMVLRKIESNCCTVDPCIYCFLNNEDGLCNCTYDLNRGKKTCPECLGKWLQGEGAMHAWMGFQKVYPIFAGWIVDQRGIPAQCPMMSGRGGSMGMMGMMGMMRMRGSFSRRNLATSNSIKEKRIDLKMKARELNLLSDYNCCMAGGGSCTYCLLDQKRSTATICDCKDKLKAGREVCPECLGTWAGGELNHELKESFKRAYPSLYNFIPKEV